MMAPCLQGTLHHHEQDAAGKIYITLTPNNVQLLTFMLNSF
jgi:hypothetical protein